MPKRTLLDMTQSILNDMSSDNVNSVDDTVESDQVVRIIRDVYFDLVERLEIPVQHTLLNLEGLGDTTKPTHMKLPDGVRYISSIRYNKLDTGDTAENYRPVDYKSPEEFLEFVYGRDNNSTDVDAITDFSGEKLLVRNDHNPTYWTSFDDEYIVFDSYNSAVDTTLQSSKTTCRGSQESSFSLTDSFIPDLPAKFFPLLLSEAKTKCFAILNQVTNAYEARAARKLTIKHKKEKARAKGGSDGYFAQGR